MCVCVCVCVCVRACMCEIQERKRVKTIRVGGDNHVQLPMFNAKINPQLFIPVISGVHNNYISLFPFR